jgi:hypothetical protein
VCAAGDDTNKSVRRSPDSRDVHPARRVSKGEHMGGIVVPKRSEMLNNRIEPVKDILGSLRVSDAWNATVIGYHGKDASQSEVGPKVVVYEVGRGLGAGTSNKPTSLEEH